MEVCLQHGLTNRHRKKWSLNVTFLKISFYSEPGKIFWIVWALYRPKCVNYCVLFYSQVSFFILLPLEISEWTEHGLELIKGTWWWNTIICWCYIAPRISDLFSRFHSKIWHNNYFIASGDIQCLSLGSRESLIWEKFPLPLVSGNITSQGFLVTLG